MSLWRSDRFLLGIGAEDFALARASKPDVALVTQALRSTDWPALGAQLSVAAQGSVTVTVADELARYMVVTPPAGLETLQDARAWLAMHFEQVYGESPADWRIEADWRPGRAMLVCALPNVLLQGLQPLKVHSMTSAFLRIWNQHCARLPATGLWCLWEGGLLRIAYWQDGDFVLYRQVRMIEPLATAALRAVLEQEFARIEALPPQQCFWSGIQGPQDWTALALTPDGMRGAQGLAWLGARA